MQGGAFNAALATSGVVCVQVNPCPVKVKKVAFIGWRRLDYCMFSSLHALSCSFPAFIAEWLLKPGVTA